MTRLSVFATLLASTTIAAADDGPTMIAPPGMQPAPAVVVVAPPPRPVELSRRWGVAARAVSMTVGKDDAATEFSGGGLAATYRLNRRWEFALALDGLDSETGPDLHSTMLEARFHLWPLRRWDAYVVGGIGGIHVMPTEGSEQPETTRGQFHAGVGFGYRWRYIGLAAELHAVGVGPSKNVDDASTMRVAPGTTQPAMSTDDSTSGGQFTVAASFYF